MIDKLPETVDQFLARMIIAVREGHQIGSHDSRRLSDLAQYGPGPVPPTMPEERREANKPLTAKGAHDLVTG